MRAVTDSAPGDEQMIGGLPVEGWAPARRALAAPDASDRAGVGQDPLVDAAAVDPLGDAAGSLRDLQRAMTEGAGVLRDAASLAATSSGGRAGRGRTART